MKLVFLAEALSLHRSLVPSFWKRAQAFYLTPDSVLLLHMSSDDLGLKADLADLPVSGFGEAFTLATIGDVSCSLTRYHLSRSP